MTLTIIVLVKIMYINFKKEIGMYENSGITASVNSVKKCLDYRLKEAYNIEDQNICDTILKIHGLHKDNFDFINNIETTINKGIADASFDSNANKNETSAVGVMAESTIPVNKIIGYRELYRQLVKDYGKKEAKRLSALMYDMSLAIADSSKLMLPYCFSLNASKLVFEGRDFGLLPSKPPKSVRSYISALSETVHQLSNHLAGACLYKDQQIIYKQNNILKCNSIKTFQKDFDLENMYTNFQGTWEYSDVNSKDIFIVGEKGKFTKITKVMRRKYNEKIYEIRTQSGKIVKCSKDHLFKVLYKGREITVKAEDLKKFDTVFNTNIYELSINKTSEDYKKGQFHGILAGDGSLTEDRQIRVAINYNQKFIADFLDNYLLDKKGHLCDGNKCFDYRICGTEFVNKIKENFIGNNCYNKHIDIENKSLEYLTGFLDGLFTADGYYNHSLGISLANKDLIQNVIDILEKLNINVKYSLIKEHDNKKDLYVLNVPLSAQEFFDLFNTRIGGLKGTKYSNRNDVAYFGQYAFFHSKGNNMKGYKTYKERDVLLHEPDTDVIISITFFDNDDDYVYEIETESHWYSVGGILTHNCAIGSLFFDVAYVAKFRENISLFQLKHNKKVRKEIENDFQSFVHSVNHLSRNAMESPFTNISVFDRAKLDKFLDDDNMGWMFAEKPKYYSIKHWKKYMIDYIMELQHIYMNFFEKGDPLHDGRPYRFPITTTNIAKEKKNDKWSIIDNRFVDDICHRDIYRYNIMVSEGSKVASCCRLVNDAELFELGGQSNSFGGSAISLGSHRVVTLNFNRMALEATSYENYYEILQSRIIDASNILISHRNLLKALTEKGLHPFISNGWLDLNKMFSTFGIMGLYESKKTLESKFGITEDSTEKSLKFLNSEARRLSIEKHNVFNIEQIPGEQISVKLSKIDKMLYGEDKVPYVLYSNQFVPLWEDATVIERMEIDGKYNSLLTGGGISHINTGEKTTYSQNKQLVTKSIECGCEHFAITIVYSECENNHNSLGDFDICPVCKERIVEKYQRVVGFFTPVSSWNKERREWEFPRRTKAKF